MITPQDFKSKMDEAIANLTDQAKVTSILGDLVTEITTGYTELTTATTTATKLTEDNEKLRQANMDLFLKIGTPSNNQNNNNPKPNENNAPKFEDLFDEKGNIK